jgi:hypothetical protein
VRQNRRTILTVDLVHNETLKISIGEGKDDVEIASSGRCCLIYYFGEAKANLLSDE